MRILTVVVLGLAAGIASAVEPDIDSFAARAARERTEAIHKLRDELNTLRADRTLSKQSRAVKEQRIAIQLEAYENPTKPYYPEIGLGELRAGLVGYLKNPDAKVFEIISDDEALVELVAWGPSEGLVRVGVNKYATVGKRPERFEKLVLLRGKPTEKWANDQTIGVTGIYSVTGNYTYETTDGGSNTVFVIEPFDINPHADKFTRKDEAREWIVNGKPVEAVFVKYERGAARLIKLDGEVVKAKLADLGPDDKTIVQDWIKAERKRKAKE